LSAVLLDIKTAAPGGPAVCLEKVKE
jgi:hypothetical protein